MDKKVKSVDKKNKERKLFLLISIILLICIIGISYAFFQYYREGKSTEIIAGDIYLLLDDGTTDLKLETVFPQTKEEARASDDNLFTFSISGKNTTLDKNLYYEIKLNEGSEVEGKKRFNPEHLKFDLYEVVGEDEVRIVDAMSFSDFNDQRIWVNTIYSETNDEVNRTYKLRMWLSDDIIISDTLPNADYTTSEFRNSFASVKISVSGDFNEKKIPYNYMKRFGGTIDLVDMDNVDGYFWPEALNSGVHEITEVRFMSMDQELIDMLYENGAMDLTDTTKSEPGSVIAVPMDTQLWIMSNGITFFPEDCSGMFLKFQSLNSIYFNNVNTSLVKNMEAMFFLAGLNFSSDSVENVNLVGFNSFDTSNVTNLSSMFYFSNVTNIDLSDWDVSNVTDMSQMFAWCSTITSLDLSNWDVSSVSDMSSMFGMTNLTSLNLSGWDVSNVTNMDNMFSSSDRLTSLDLSNWNTKNITDLSNFFRGSNLQTLNLSNWNVSNVTDMSYMFFECENLISLNLSNWDVSNVTSMHDMFLGCQSLKTIYANNDWKLMATKLTDSNDMFSMCDSLVGKVAYDSGKTDISMANPFTGYFTRK